MQTFSVKIYVNAFKILLFICCYACFYDHLMPLHTKIEVIERKLQIKTLTNQGL